MKLSTVTYLGILVLLSFGLAPQAYAANISFTENTELALTGLATTLYALSGSEADTLTVDDSTLTVDIPAGSSFTLGAGSPVHNVLKITPTGSTTLTFEGANLTSAGYATQWTLQSSAASWVILVGVSQPSTTYNIHIDSNHYGVFQASSAGEIGFTYAGNVSSKVFTIELRGGAGSTSSGPVPLSSPPPSAETPTSTPTPTPAPAGGPSPELLPSTGPVGEQEGTLEIFDVRGEQIGPGSIRISWRTNKPSDSRVDYGTNDSYNFSVFDGNITQEHSVVLEDLESEATYQIRVTSTTPEGEVAFFEATSLEELLQGEGGEIIPQTNPEETPLDASRMNAISLVLFVGLPLLVFLIIAFLLIRRIRERAASRT